MALRTVLELYDDWETNSDYAEVGSLSKARAFVTAGVRLLNRDNQSTEHGGERIQKRDIREELAIARRWIAVEAKKQTTAGAVRTFDCSRSMP